MRLFNKIFSCIFALIAGAFWTFSCVNAESLLVSTINSNSILRFDGSAGTFIETFAAGSELSAPHALTIGPDGNLYVGSRGNDSVLRYDGETGSFIDVFVLSGSGGLLNTHGLSFGPDGNFYVCSQDTDEVLRYDGTTGAFIDVFASGPELDYAYDLEFGPDSNLYVSSTANNTILRYDGVTGAFIDIFASGGGLDGPTGLHFAPDGNLYVASYLNDSVIRYDGLNGIYIDTFVPSGSGGMTGGPIDLAFGPDGNLYVTSLLDDAVFRFDGTSGAYIDIFIQPGSGGLGLPAFLLFIPDPPPPPPEPKISVTTGGPEFRINAGGIDYTDTNGDLFVADKAFVTGDYGYVGGGTGIFLSEISGTSDDLLYQSVHGGSSFSYDFDVIPEGDYKITFYFMEPFWTTSGERLFDVVIEDVPVLTNYDIAAVSGGAYAARAEAIVSSVSDNQLNIDFVGVARVALVSAISVVSYTVDFGNITLGTSSDKIVTITNDGTADLAISSLSTINSDFSIVSPTAPFIVLPGEDQAVTVRFNPTVSGAQTGTLEITSNDLVESLVLISLLGSAPLNEPDITLTPTGINFGRTLLGNIVSDSVTVTNDGLQTLSVSDLTIINPAFTIVSPATPFDVLPGGSQQVVIEFNPVIVGAETGSLDITSNDPDEGTTTTSLTGEGIDQLAFRINIGQTDFTDSNGDLFVANKAFVSGDFGYVGSGGTNTGLFLTEVIGTTDDLLYQSMHGESSFSYYFDNLPDGDYEITLYFMEPFWTVTGGRLFDVYVEGNPVLTSFDIVAASGGSYVANTQYFVVNVSDGQLNVDFSGVVRIPIISAISVVKASTMPSLDEPDITVTPASINFGRALLGNIVSDSVTVTNDGLQTLTVSDLTIINPAFTIVSPATPFDVLPGVSQQVVIEFNPVIVGAETGSLDITSNDPDEGTTTTSLTGEGIDQLAFRINIGQTDFTDSNGDLFVANKAFVSGDFGYVGSVGTNTGLFLTEVIGTTDDLLYQSMHGESSFSYYFDNLPDGDYEITLYFMEPFWTVTGERLFDVYVEGNPVLTSFDIVAASGGSYVANTQYFVVNVSDGQLNVDFANVNRIAIVSAISVTLQ